MNGRNFPRPKNFLRRADPVMVGMLIGGVLLGCGILIGHVATVAIR